MATGFAYDDFDEHSEDFEEEPLVRPFMVTGGRTDADLAIEAMVVDAAAGSARLPGTEEYRRLYRLCSEPLAIAELSARASLPLGVVRVLVADLVASGALTIAEVGLAGVDELDFIDRIILAVERL